MNAFIRVDIRQEECWLNATESQWNAYNLLSFFEAIEENKSNNM